MEKVAKIDADEVDKVYVRTSVPIELVTKQREMHLEFSMPTAGSPVWRFSSNRLPSTTAPTFLPV